MWQTLQRIFGKLKKSESGWPICLEGGGGNPCMKPSARGSESAALGQDPGVDAVAGRDKHMASRSTDRRDLHRGALMIDTLFVPLRPASHPNTKKPSTKLVEGRLFVN